jgi:hypothetical protein
LAHPAALTVMKNRDRKLRGNVVVSTDGIIGCEQVNVERPPHPVKILLEARRGGGHTPVVRLLVYLEDVRSRPAGFALASAILRRLAARSSDAPPLLQPCASSSIVGGFIRSTYNSASLCGVRPCSRTIRCWRNSSRMSEKDIQLSVSDGTSTVRPERSAGLLNAFSAFV